MRSRIAMVPKKSRKHISFGRAPKVTIVRAPPRGDHRQLWFQESEKVVTKPLVFDIGAGGEISINIGLSVRLTSIGCASQRVGRVALRISGDSENPQWIVCGSTCGGEVSKINVVLPAGEYLLQCSGEASITVFGQAADVERRLE